MNDDSKFRPIPKLDSFKIPFKLEEKALLDWLINLNQYEGREACSQTLALLQVLNKTDLSVKNRLIFLNLINEYLKYFIKYLEGQCWDSGFPLSIEENVYAEMITWNYLLLGQGFFKVAEQANKKKDILLALARALESLGLAQLHIAATYYEPVDGFWQLNYQIFAWAKKRKLQHLPIEHDDFQDLTLNTLFARSLIFKICDTRQFHPRDMRSIFNFLPKVCQGLPIGPHSEEHGLFMVDLKSDTPPHNVKAQLTLGSDLVRYFSPLFVANAIHNILNQNDTWTGTLKSLNTTLFSRVAKTLELKQKRKHTRKKQKHDLLGVIGFECIVGFLYKVRKNTGSEPEKISHKPTPESKQPKPLALQDYPTTQKNAISATQIWGEQDLNTEAAIKTPVKKVSLQEIKVYDSSANGYAVSWNPPPENVKIGDLIGIISADRKRLEIAIIRRIALSSGDIIRRIALKTGSDFDSDLSGDFRFGAEVLAFESEIVYLSSLTHPNRGAWAVFIPGNGAEQADTLIYSIGQFRAGENIHLHRGHHTILGLLLKELNATAAISHVELTYPQPHPDKNK